MQTVDNTYLLVIWYVEHTLIIITFKFISNTILKNLFVQYIPINLSKNRIGKF